MILIRRIIALAIAASVMAILPLQVKTSRVSPVAINVQSAAAGYASGGSK
jgi:hypothetical protein